MDNKREWHAETRYTRMISARLPLAEYEQLKNYCEENGHALTDVVRFALREYIDAREGEKGRYL